MAPAPVRSQRGTRGKVSAGQMIASAATE
jgi:hypothetical protein